MSVTVDTNFLQYAGTISEDEAQFLEYLAAAVSSGVIVEIGSYRGKSAIALAAGATKSVIAASMDPLVYSVDQHRNARGICGGRFGPPDREAFFQAMVHSGYASRVALVNLPSVDTARVFRQPIGLLFIDGDHTEAGVQADIDAWLPHLTPDAIVVFDDAHDPSIGPFKVIERLRSTGRFQPIGGTGKVLALRRTAEIQYCEDRNRNIAAVTTAAEKQGVAPWFAVSRLSYGTFVSSVRRYAFMEMPKAASTTLKNLILQIEGATYDPKSDTPYFRETRLDMLVHQRRFLAVPTLLDLSQDDFRNATRGSEGWMTFVVSRNPYSRLVSIFLNKILLAEPGFEQMTERLCRLDDNRPLTARFMEFVNTISDEMAAVDGNAHLTLQCDTALMSLISYTHVFKLEQLAKAIQSLANHVGRSGLETPVKNASLRINWRAFYDKDSAARIARIYAKDFETFHYDPDDWRATDVASPRLSEDAVWGVREIRDRNAFIEHLYNLLLK